MGQTTPLNLKGIMRQNFFYNLKGQYHNILKEFKGTVP